MEYIWECMTIAFKGFIGFILWTCVLATVFMIATLFSKEWRDNYRIQKFKARPKYKGEPIVIKGGKKDET